MRKILVPLAVISGGLLSYKVGLKGLKVAGEQAISLAKMHAPGAVEKIGSMLSRAKSALS